MIITETLKYQPVMQQQSAGRQGEQKAPAGSDAYRGLKLLSSGQDAVSVEKSQDVGPGMTAKPEKSIDSSAAADQKATEQAVEKLEKTLSELKHNKLEFTVHEKTGRTIVKVVDQDTGDVIKELPPEELLDLAAKLEEMSGVLFDRKI